MMSNLIRAGMALLVFVLLPLLTGSTFLANGSADTEGRDSRILYSFVLGNMIQLALFQLAAVPLVVWHRDFRILMGCWLVLLVLFNLVCIWKAGKNGFHRTGNYKGGGSGKEGKLLTVLLLVAFLIIGFQCAVYFFGTHIDDDDSRFLGHALDAYQNNRMIATDQARGGPPYAMNADYAKDTASPWPLYVAMLARFIRMHSTIFAHTILPVYLLLLSYCIYYLIGKELMEGNRNRTLGFLAVLAGTQLFFAGSLKTQSEFTLLRIWQGKAAVAAIGVPMIWLCFLRLYRMGNVRKGEKVKVGFSLGYLTVLIVNLACCLLSGMGIFLGAALTGILAGWYALAYRAWKTLPGFIAACIPSAIYAALYFLMKKLGFYGFY